MVKPCKRKLLKNCAIATLRLTGFSVTKVMVPLTRGSTTTFMPEIKAIVRATASISALLKFKVIGSPGLMLCANATLQSIASSKMPVRKSGSREGVIWFSPQ